MSILYAASATLWMVAGILRSDIPALQLGAMFLILAELSERKGDKR